LAEAYGRRITRGFLLTLALAAGLAASAYAQPIGTRSPSWAELSPPEKQFLTPFASEWDNWDAQRKAKWRGIAQRYPKMAPDEQERVRQQMTAWAQLSPAERQAARERYKSLKTLPPEKKQEVRQKWEQYQSLPPETKRELAAKPTPGATPSGARGAPRPAPTAPPPPPPASPPPTPASGPPPVK
jgi:Protein of unknown function (DUF3106)